MIGINIAIPIFDGVDELDAVGPFEVFRNAVRFGADLTCELTSLEESAITASHGLRMFPTAKQDAKAWSCLFIPGGNWAKPTFPGVRAEIERGNISRLVSSSFSRGVHIASVCTGAMLLASAGILKGRRAITHHVAKQALADEGAIVIDARIVDDGDIMTAGGVTAGLDLAFYLVFRWFGMEVADKTAQLMEYERGGEVFYRGKLVPLGTK